MAWKDAAAELGTGRLVSRLTALKATMKKRDFKRLVATTVAQVLEAHPDVGRRKARRWARKVTGTRPGKIGKKAPGAAALTGATTWAACNRKTGHCAFPITTIAIVRPVRFC